MGDLVRRAARAMGDGRHREALRFSRQALRLDPQDVEALTLSASALVMLDDMIEAESLIDTALAFQPDYLPARLRRGVLFEIAGDFQRAEQAFRWVLGREPRHGEALLRLANVEKALGRLPAALQGYGRVLEFNPDDVGALVNRGAVLAELGKPLEAMESYKRALARQAGHEDALYNLAVLYQEQGSPAAAVETYDRLLAERPGHGGALVNRAYAVKELEGVEAAIDATRAAARELPGYDKLHVNLGDLHLEAGAAGEALKVADDYLARHPANPSMLAFKGIALADVDREAAVDLLALDDLLRPVRLEAPKGYPDISAFNRDLARHVRSHPSLVRDPKSHATRSGRHSGELLVEPKGPVAGLEAAIMRAVEGYREAVPLSDAHPWTARRPGAVGLSVWGVVMETGGHQVPHIHPSAWLSGVYYPEIPPSVRDGDPGHKGWIEFGRAPGDFHGRAEPILRLIRPEEGLMILFPSYLYHRTVPLEGAAERVSIAFDVLSLN